MNNLNLTKSMKDGPKMIEEDEKDNAVLPAQISSTQVPVAQAPAAQVSAAQVPLFYSSLPPKIQLKVCEFVKEGPRTIMWQHIKSSTSFIDRDPLTPKKYKFVLTESTNPASLSAFHGLRMGALKKYKPLQGDLAISKSSVLYFNEKRDYLVLNVVRSKAFCEMFSSE